MEMNKNCITIFKRASPTKKTIHFDARKHWKRLQRVVLSGSGTMPRENDAIIHNLKAQRKDIMKKEDQLKVMFEKSIQDAKKALAKAELKSEHTSTSHKKEVTNLKRKMIISEHSKIIEKVFEEGRKDANHTKSTDQVADSLRLIRKMEAQHDRLRARKLRLKKMARERLKVKKKDEQVDEDSMMQMGGDEMQWWKKNHKNKLRQHIEKEDGEAQYNSMLDNPERGYKNIQGSTVDTNNEDYTKSQRIKVENHEMDTSNSSRNVKERQRYNRITNGKGILPSVFETEIDDSEIKNEIEADMLVDKLQMYERENTRPNLSRKNETTLPLLKRIPKKLSDNRMEFIRTAEYDSYSSENSLSRVNNRYKNNTLEFLYKEDADDINEVHEEEMKNSTKLNKTMHLKSKKEGTSFPQLVKKPGNTISSFDDFIRESNNTMKRSNETAMQASSENIPDKISQSILQYRQRDASYCESTWSSLTLNSSLEWASSRNHRRSVKEIYNALCDVGLNINAAALDYSLRTIIEEHQDLQEKLQEVKNALAREKERKKLEEKEKLKIKKMKKAYDRYKKGEKERREREELKRKLQEEADRRIEKHRKLYKEMMLLAMENNLSRNYNFSYFMTMKPQIEGNAVNSPE